MPKSTMQEQSEYRFPTDTLLPVLLEEVSVRTIRYTRNGEEKSFDKWEWTFVIVDGEYADLNVYGETEDRLTSHPDNKVRQWAEVLRGSPFEMGEDLDTEDLIGLPASVTVRHDPPREKRDGGFFYGCPVDQIFPEGTTTATAPGLVNDGEPPF